MNRSAWFFHILLSQGILFTLFGIFLKIVEEDFGGKIFWTGIILLIVCGAKALAESRLRKTPKKEDISLPGTE